MSSALGMPIVLLWIAWQVRAIVPPWMPWTLAISAVTSILVSVPMLIFHPVLLHVTGIRFDSNHLGQIFSLCSVIGAAARLLFLIALIGITMAFCRCRRELDGLRLIHAR